MHHAQGSVAVIHSIGNHAQRSQIGNLTKVNLLLFHLIVNAVDVLSPSLNVSRYSGLAQCFLESPLHRLQLRDSGLETLAQFFDDVPISCWFQVLQR